MALLTMIVNIVLSRPDYRRDFRYTIVMVRTFVLLLLCAGCTRFGEATEREPDASECAIPTMVEHYGGESAPATFGPGITAPPCTLTKHDVVIILGCPTSSDGSASTCQRARVDLALEAKRRGLGDRFIVSGGAVANAFVEADSLARLLGDRGVNEDAIVLEPKARHTDENLYFSSLIMQARGWSNALVVSEDPRQLVMVATCDANCCVGLGRLTVFDMLDVPFSSDGGTTTKLGHYVLFPNARRVAEEECEVIKPKLMCLALPERRACAGRITLAP
jgi:hypothetical protein